MKTIHRRREATGGLASQRNDVLRVGVKVHIARVGDEVEVPHPGDGGGRLAPISFDDRTGEGDDLARFRHLLLKGNPELFDFFDARKLRALTHLGGQHLEGLAATRELGADHGAFEDPNGVPSYLLKHAEELPEGAQARIQLLLELTEATLVLFELGLEAVGALLLRRPLGLGGVQHALLLRLLLNELALPVLVHSTFEQGPLFHEFQEIVEVAGLTHFKFGGIRRTGNHNAPKEERCGGFYE